MDELNWPEEIACDIAGTLRWCHSGSNVSLDLHGDPLHAALTVFSDGNHHMALCECLRYFAQHHTHEIFYVTLPPTVLLDWLAVGRLQLGNLSITATPHVFVSPSAMLDRVVAAGRMSAHVPFARSCGNVLLVRRGNPKRIGGVADLNRTDVRLFLPNPTAEAASYQAYSETLRALARREGIPTDFLGSRTVYGERIHHREAPQAVAAGRADVALVYYHLALRYTRIFPELFELVALAGAPHRPEMENRITDFHVGVVDDGGAWGKALVDFLLSGHAAQIYRAHGLRAPRD